MNSVDRTREQLATLTPDRLEAVAGLMWGWRNESSAEVLPISEAMAVTVVNEWILSVLPDRFTAVEARRIAAGDIWCVAVGLAYPRIGLVGQVGEVLVSAFSGGIISATRPEDMKAAGLECYAKREHEIKSAFLSAGNA